MKEKTVYVVRWIYRDTDGIWVKGGIGGIFGSKRLAEQFEKDNSKSKYRTMITTMTMYEEDNK